MVVLQKFLKKIFVTMLLLTITGVQYINCTSDPSKTIYTAVFLDQESHIKLLDMWNSTVPYKSNLGQLYGTHMTLQFAPTQSEVDALPKGLKTSVYPFIWASDLHTCQGVQVFSPYIKSNNSFSHVTVSTGDHTGAVCTNDLIANVYNNSNKVYSGTFRERFQLNGCVDTFPHSGKCEGFLKRYDQ
jgi:hypothetical protein